MLQILLTVYKFVVKMLWIEADVCTIISLSPLSASLCLALSLHLFITFCLPYKHISLSPPVSSLNVVCALCLCLFNPYVSIIDQSFTTTSRCVSQMVWLLTPIFP